MKKLLLIILVALVLGAVTVACAAIYLGSAAEAIMDASWDDITGKDVPVPWPLAEAEVQALRDELGATWPEDDPEDPISSVDLDAIALKRAIERGEHLVQARLGCTECHDTDFGGKLYADVGPVFVLRAPNITTGAGGLPDTFGVKDWDRIVRHGVNRAGRTAIMPAVDYQELSDRELSDVIAYVRSQPPVDRTVEPSERGPIGTMLIARGLIVPSVYEVDHDRLHRAEPPKEEVSVEFGRHLSRVCVGCHRADLRGGPIAGGDPKWAPAANLTPHEDGLAGWSTADFVKAMREGVRPDGTALDPSMPWPMLAKMTDTELEALATYLQSLDPLPTGE